VNRWILDDPIRPCRLRPSIGGSTRTSSRSLCRPALKLTVPDSDGAVAARAVAHSRFVPASSPTNVARRRGPLSARGTGGSHPSRGSESRSSASIISTSGLPVTSSGRSTRPRRREDAHVWKMSSVAFRAFCAPSSGVSSPRKQRTFSAIARSTNAQLCSPPSTRHRFGSGRQAASPASPRGKTLTIAGG